MEVGGCCCCGLKAPPNEVGDATALRLPGVGCPGKGNCCNPWLEADDVGIGGEKGNGGYCMIVARLLRGACEGFGEMDAAEGGGSSSASDTPRALSLASVNSSTYLFQAIEAISARLLSCDLKTTHHQCRAE